VDVKGGGQSISGSGSIQNTSLLSCQYHSTSFPRSFANAVTSCQLKVSSNKTRKNKLGLISQSMVCFHLLTDFGFFYATSRDLADGYRSFGGKAVEERVC
jgi:hypothetical protein